MRVFGNGGRAGFVPMLRILNRGEELQLNVGIIESRFSKSFFNNGQDEDPFKINK